MQRKLIVILASVALLIALVSIAQRFRPVAPVIDAARYVGLGQALAEETTKVAGKVVAVINAQHQLAGNPIQAEWETFRKHVNVVATEVVPVDPQEMVLGNSCSVAQLQTILAKHAGADAIVFFIGLPEWTKQEARGITLAPIRAKLVVLVDGAVPRKGDYGGYFTSGFLSTLIGARALPAQAAEPKSPREWFDKYYQVYTAQTLSE